MGYGVIKINNCAYCKKSAGKKQKLNLNVWLNGRLENLELYYCSDACKSKIEEFARFNNKYGAKLMLAIIAWAVLLVVVPYSLEALTGNILYFKIAIGLMLSLAGIVIIKCPLAIGTSKHYRRLGIRNITLFLKLTGVLMIYAGIRTML